MRLTHGAMAVVIGVSLLAAAAAPAAAAPAAAAPAAAAPAAGAPTSIASTGTTTGGELLPEVATDPAIGNGVPAPTSIAQCLASANVRCYSPLEYQAAYNLTPLYKQGITGKGETIAIIESYGSPTIRHDLAVFDRQWHLTNPVLNILTYGSIPGFDATNATMVAWAQETSLDVEYAHALAPGATIDLVETPIPETEGLAGFPQMAAAEEALISRYKPDVISQSFGATESTLPRTGLGAVRSVFGYAAANDVTVLAASGDSGATSPGPDGVTLYTHRAVSWPASDPLVTAVGGTDLTLNQAGQRLAPDKVWNDAFGASGGGVSQIFAAPSFQAGVESVTGDHRGVPDIAMSAAVSGAAWTYESFDGTKNAWSLFGGTSEAAPLFAGIVALADQAAGHPLGDINTALYALGAENAPTQTGIDPVTNGDNSFDGVAGYKSGSGYTLADGWGTVNAAVFVPALAHYAPPLPVMLRVLRY
jgi:subtilase family serine protease